MSIVLVLVLAAALVAGCGSGDDAGEATAQGGDPAAVEAAEQDALRSYERYLEAEAADLLDMVELLENRVAVERPASRVQAAYGAARVAYGHLLPAAYLFPELDRRINGHAGEQPGGRLTGFHGIERTLYGEETIEGLGPLSKQFVVDVRRLRREIASAELQPLPLAEAAERLTGNVAGRMMAGEEEPYARTDLADVSAGVEGAEKSFEAVKPLLADSDPALVKEIEGAFAEAYERLGEHGAPARDTQGWDAGTFYVPYGDLDRNEIQEIGEPLDALVRLFREVPGQLPRS